MQVRCRCIIWRIAVDFRWDFAVLDAAVQAASFDVFRLFCYICYNLTIEVIS